MYRWWQKVGQSGRQEKAGMGGMSGEAALWYCTNCATRPHLHLLLIRNNETRLSSQRDQSHLLKLQKFYCQQSCLKISQICHGHRLFSAFCLFFSSNGIHCRQRWDALGTVWTGKIENWKEEDARREISNMSFISEGQDSLSPLPIGTEHQLRAPAHPRCVLRARRAHAQVARQLSQLRENSLVWRIAWEAKAPSTIPSAIPTDWETLKKKNTKPTLTFSIYSLAKKAEKL